MEKKKIANEPKVLGTLRKERSSKPIFVFLVFALIVGTTFALPYIEDYIKNPGTYIGALFTKVFGAASEENEILESSKQLLNKETELLFNNILFSNFILKDKTITYDIINTVEETITLDKTNYYIEIYNSEAVILNHFKLTGDISKEKAKTVTLLSDTSYSSSVMYFGKIIDFKDYEDVTLNMDESGLGTINCKKITNNYNYIFENNLLKNVEQKYENKEINNIENYLESFNFNINKTKQINSLIPGASTTLEKEQGFEFSSKIDLSKIKVDDLGAFVDYNYYNLDTPAKKIKHEMEAKGFKCK